MTTIGVHKKEWLVCGGLCCSVSYLDCNPSVFCSQEAECLCFRSDCVCLGEDNRKPIICGYLGVVCYPTLAFCKPLSHFYGDEAKFGDKKDNCVCGGICLGPVCRETGYVKMPSTLCKHEVRRFGICVNDCALPCADDVPVVCNCPYCPGLICYPTCACCPKTEALFPNANYVVVPTGLENEDKIVGEQPMKAADM
eukprot:CAMPEP_0119262394 /NCGR_PEP_ID=MMETSP1329-20130426/2131_1 /TAXON_ID=114041 /ORGANISM="Genus nov. species nov., Strain RCC1024" /LENGTH=195 /DNA_ID=CAMNT_0007262029 /DNA_START=45 /DNA_END=632 /DNA_ORIENTATION=+